MQDAPTIGIIGAGFSGTLLAVHMLRLAPPTLRIILVERDDRFGRGLAYSTSNPKHLLNVRAENMSAFPDRPADFLDWLHTQETDGSQGPTRNEPLFASRGLYGNYITQCLTNEIWHHGHARNLYLMNDEAVRLERNHRGLVLTLLGGRSHRLDLGVLAVGNLPPETPPVADSAFFGSGLYRADPWDPSTLDGLDPNDPIFMIGTGLSMVDVVVSLIGRGHAGPIYALSRHGLTPRRHAAVKPLPPLHRGDLPANVRAITRLLRARIARAEVAGGDWRAVIDAMRPISQSMWVALPVAERGRFLRHLRSWWDVHRHRTAPAVARLIEQAKASGQLHILAGRIQSFEEQDGRVEVVYRPRGESATRSLRAAIVVNCSGPGCDFTRIRHPLVRQMLDDGLIRPDALALGLDTSVAGSVIDRDGRDLEDLFAIGPLTKATYGEITAVPDIRSQCAQLARDLVARMARRMAAGEAAEPPPG